MPNTLIINNQAIFAMAKSTTPRDRMGSAGSMEKITFQHLKARVDHLHKNLAYEREQLTQEMIHVRNLAMASKNQVRDFMDQL